MISYVMHKTKAYPTLIHIMSVYIMILHVTAMHVMYEVIRQNILVITGKVYNRHDYSSFGNMVIGYRHTFLVSYFPFYCQVMLKMVRNSNIFSNAVLLVF